MRGEDAFMYGSSLLLLFLIIVAYRLNKRFGVISILIYFAFSLPLYYLFIFKGQGGSTLLYLFYITILTWIQLIVLSVYLIRKKSRKQ